MDAYRVFVWLHILLGIALVGQALFWVVMLASLRQRFGAAGAMPWLVAVKAARWPHVAVPYKYRLPLPLVAWATLLVASASGVLLVVWTREPQGALWTAKLVLLAGVAILQVVLTVRPLPLAIIGNLLLTLAVMVVSGWMVRG
jgi:hypothetical protein